MSQRKNKQAQNRTNLIVALVLAASAILSAAYLLWPRPEKPTQADAAAETTLFFSCAYRIDTGGEIQETIRPEAACQSWAEETLREHLGDVRDCQQIYRDEFSMHPESVLMANFEDCVTSRGIEYPPSGE